MWKASPYLSGAAVPNPAAKPATTAHGPHLRRVSPDWVREHERLGWAVEDDEQPPYGGEPFILMRYAGPETNGWPPLPTERIRKLRLARD